MGLPMFNKPRTFALLTLAVFACGSARGQNVAAVDKPLLPPPPSGDVVTQSYTDDAPLYNPSGSTANTSAPAGANSTAAKGAASSGTSNSATAKSASSNSASSNSTSSNSAANSATPQTQPTQPQQTMSANEMVRRHLGTPQPVWAKPQITAGTKSVAAHPVSVPSAALTVPTVSIGQPESVTAVAAKPPVAPAAAQPVAPAAAQPVASHPVESATPRDTRPLSQRLQALRQPVVIAGKSDSWDEANTDAAAGSAPQTTPSTPNSCASASQTADNPSSRRATASADDAASHPLSLSDSAAPNLSPPGLPSPSPSPSSLTPLSPESDAPQAVAEPAVPQAPVASNQPPRLHSSRRTVVNPEDLAVPEPTATASDNVLFKRQSPLLSVETTGPRTVVIGKEALYTVTLNNGGDVAAQDLVVGVKIPDWTDVVGSQTSAGTTRPSTSDGADPFQWRIPRLEAHGKETLSLRLVPRKGRPFDLAVQWTFSPTASQTMVDVQEPKLQMNIAGPDEVLFGQSKLYRLTLSNPGTGKAENVAIDLWPVGNSTAGPTRHPLGSLRAGESKVVELELTARQGGNVTIHAAAVAEPGLKAEATQQVLVRRAAIAVSIDGAKSRYAGTMAGYKIKVSNPGNAAADNVRVFAALPQDAKFASATQGGQWKADQGRVVWTLSTLRPGEELVLELRCTLASPGANKMQVMSNAAGDLSDMADVVTNVEALADLKLDVSEPAGPIAVGDDMVYELHVHNRGTKSAESVSVVAYFSDGLEPISADGGAHDISNGVVAFRPLASLAVGGEVIYHIHARAQKFGKQIFRTEVECGTLGTKLVNAEEAMIYPSDGGVTSPEPEKSLARRNPDPALPTGTRR